MTIFVHQKDRKAVLATTIVIAKDMMEISIVFGGLQARIDGVLLCRL